MLVKLINQSSMFKYDFQKQSNFGNNKINQNSNQIKVNLIQRSKLDKEILKIFINSYILNSFGSIITDDINQKHEYYGFFIKPNMFISYLYSSTDNQMNEVLLLKESNLKFKFGEEIKKIQLKTIKIYKEILIFIISNEYDFYEYGYISLSDHLNFESKNISLSILKDNITQLDNETNKKTTIQLELLSKFTQIPSQFIFIYEEDYFYLLKIKNTMINCKFIDKQYLKYMNRLNPDGLYLKDKAFDIRILRKCNFNNMRFYINMFNESYTYKCDLNHIRHIKINEIALKDLDYYNFKLHRNLDHIESIIINQKYYNSRINHLINNENKTKLNAKSLYFSHLDGYSLLNYFSYFEYPKLEKLSIRWSNSYDLSIILKNDFSLKSIEIYNGKIKDEGIEILSKMNMENLIFFDLTSNAITHKGIDYLKSCNLLKLQHLNLSNNFFGDIGIEYLSKIRLPGLRFIDLTYNNIGFNGIKYLSYMKIEYLETILIGRNKFGDKGIRHFIKMSIPYIRTLNFECNQITNKGLYLLSQMNVPFLENAYFKGNSYGKEGIEIIKKMNITNIHY